MMPTIDYRNAAVERIPGATTVINANLGWSKGALMGWAFNQGKAGKASLREEADLAADAGTIGHYLIECHLKEILPDTSTFPKDLLDKAETSYLNFLDWEAGISLEIKEVEPHLVSEVYQYGTTPDVIAKVKGKLSIIECKTGNDVYSEHLIQVAAQRVAWEENHPDMLLEGGFHLLRIDKETAAFDHHYRYALPEAFEAFLLLLELHKLHKKIR